MSDDGTQPPGNESNPIVLDSDSDDEADFTPVQRGTAVPPLLNASRPISQRKELQPVSPSGSDHSARSHASQSRSPPGVATTGDENVLAESETSTSENEIVDKLQSPLQLRGTESPSTQTKPPLPDSDLPSVEPIDQLPATNVNSDRVASPVQNGSEVRDKVPNIVSEPTCGGSSSPVASPSPSLVDSETQNMETSPHRPAMTHLPSSPNRGHDLPTDALKNSSPVRVRGTLYSGPSGLWKDFFRVATGEQVSPSRPSRSAKAEEQGDTTRPKGGSNTPRVNSPRNVSSSTLVSLTRNMSIGASPTRSTVVARDSPEIPDDLMVTTPDGVSSLTSGEFFTSITSWDRTRLIVWFRHIVISNSWPFCRTIHTCAHDARICPEGFLLSRHTSRSTRSHEYRGCPLSQVNCGKRNV